MIVHRDNISYEIRIDKDNPENPVFFSITSPTNIDPSECAKIGRMLINASEAALNVWKPPVAP